LRVTELCWPPRPDGGGLPPLFELLRKESSGLSRRLAPGRFLPNSLPPPFPGLANAAGMSSYLALKNLRILSLSARRNSSSFFIILDSSSAHCSSSFFTLAVDVLSKRAKYSFFSFTSLSSRLARISDKRRPCIFSLKDIMRSLSSLYLLFWRTSRSSWKCSDFDKASSICN